MKLISNYELNKYSDSELSALFCTVSTGLVSTIAGPNWDIASNRTWSGRSTNISTVPRTRPCAPR